MTIIARSRPGIADRAKWCHAARRVPKDAVQGLEAAPECLRSGELLLAEVEKIGQHKRVQLHDGRYSRLFPGDLLVLAAGDRFATDQFTGRAGVRPDATLDLLAGGGIAGIEESRNRRVAAPTRLRLHGQLRGGDGAVIALDQFALAAPPRGRPATVFAVLGTGMNAGKTDAAAALINGLSQLGHRVAGIKATGTAAFCDTHLYADAGAAAVLDFTDAGMASTFRQPAQRIEAALALLLSEAVRRGCNTAVVELADGVAQVETAALIARPALRASIDGVLLAAGDPLAAEAGSALLRAAGLAPVALTGLMAGSPAALPDASGLPVLCRDMLADPATASALSTVLGATQAA
jgi:hypothetical protein